LPGRAPMIIQYVFEIFYLTLIATIIAFILTFYMLSGKPPKNKQVDNESKGESVEPHGMERSERSWLYFLLAIVLIGNLVTLSPLIPSASYGMWTRSTPVETITIQVVNYHFMMPQVPITVPVGKVVEFILVSHDVTYGFGVFRKDGTMVFQMQVVPEPYKNTLLWVFDQPGFYDVRSTEYSGPLSPFMYLPDAVHVEG